MMNDLFTWHLYVMHTNIYINKNKKVNENDLLNDRPKNVGSV